MILVLGVNAATWQIINPNLTTLPAFRKLCQLGHPRPLVLREEPISPSVWCSFFSDKTPQEHRHHSYVVNDRIVRREDIPVKFIWELANENGRKAVAINVPFVIPPYSYGTSFKPVGFGLPTTPEEWEKELQLVTATTEELLARRPDPLISVYTLLDRVQHFHWGQPGVLSWYQRLDQCLEQLLFETGLFDLKNDRLILISDHGFYSFGEARVRTLPEKTESGTLKGDHHEEAVLITLNIDQPIATPQDVFKVIEMLLGI